MSTTVRQKEEFGRDLGLIHEVVVTGRKVGADRDFWSSLAHNAELFSEIVDRVRGLEPPIIQYTKLLLCHRDPDHETVRTFRETHAGDPNFGRRARVLDLAWSLKV